MVTFEEEVWRSGGCLGKVWRNFRNVFDTQFLNLSGRYTVVFIELHTGFVYFYLYL